MSEVDEKVKCNIDIMLINAKITSEQKSKLLVCLAKAVREVFGEIDSNIDIYYIYA
jgi:hypothetical protein